MVELNIAGTVVKWFGEMIAATVVEIGLLAGVFVLFSILLIQMQKRTTRLLEDAFGWRAVLYSTGWIGTSAHELGHALMCVLFNHKITDVSLFRPDSETGELGHVHHAYDPENLYQQIGNFFIGIAPLITGGALLVGLLYAFFDGYSAVIRDIVDLPSTSAYSFADFFRGIGTAVWGTLKVVFGLRSIISWQFWVFFYISISVSTHLAPSRADMESVWPGVATGVLLLLIINGIAVAAGWDYVRNTLKLTRFLLVPASFFAVAVVLSMVNLLLAYVAASFQHWRRYRSFLSPI